MNIKQTIREWLWPTISFIIILIIFGSCTMTVSKCWARGGSVIKNAFDWPICVEIIRK